MTEQERTALANKEFDEVTEKYIATTGYRRDDVVDLRLWLMYAEGDVYNYTIYEDSDEELVLEGEAIGYVFAHDIHTDEQDEEVLFSHIKEYCGLEDLAKIEYIVNRGR